MLDDPKPSWVTRILTWLLSWLKRRDRQAAVDAAATTRNEEAEHAVQRVESQPAPVRSDTDRRLSNGSF